jgi:hypothetical protein
MFNFMRKIEAKNMSHFKKNKSFRPWGEIYYFFRLRFLVTLEMTVV